MYQFPQPGREGFGAPRIWALSGSSGRFRPVATAVLAAGFALLISSPAAAVTFTDVTASAGISHVQSTIATTGAKFYTGGAAAGDFDGDGLVDLVFTRLGASEILYRNLGNGAFEPRTTSAGFGIATQSSGVASADIDNDGDLDLYVTGMGTTRNYLYTNDGHGFFTASGLGEAATLPSLGARNGHGVSFGDYDDDGYLDLATSDWGTPIESSQARLLRNKGASQPGQFQDVTAAAGVNVYRTDANGTNLFSFRYQPRFVDLDRDGRMDLTFASDFKTSQLFWNNGDGTFADGTIPAGVGTDDNGMGSTFADYDRDGDLDWFITNINDNPQSPVHGGNNKLYRNDGNRTFTDVTGAAGVLNSGWSWGTTFFDYDNDGDDDLAATNGFNGPGWVDDRTRLWRNDGGVFADVGVSLGVADTLQGRGLIHLDYDNDGDLDMVVVNNGAVAPILYRNDGGNENHYLRINTQGTTSNRDGIGAWITVTPDLALPSDRMVWEIDGGSSFLSQNERTAHFGLGPTADGVDLVTIEWPSGLVQTLYDLPIDQTLKIVEPTAATRADFNGDGVVDAADMARWQISCGLNAHADANGDGVSDGADLLILQQELTVAASAHAAATPVPEPTTAALALLAAALLARRQR